MKPLVPRDLRSDLEVERLDPGRYAAHVSDAWDFVTPSGGVLLSVALRALERELADPALPLVSATATFCEAVPAGPVEIEALVLRRGGAAAQLRAVLRARGAGPGPGLEVSATFARHRPGPELVTPPPADLPSWDEARPAPPLDRTMRFFDNLEDRIALGYLHRDRGWGAGAPRFARWLRYHVPPRLPDGRLDPLALPPVADLMPPALVQALGPDAPRYLMPSLDLTVHFCEPTERDRLLVETRALWAAGGRASAQAVIWDDAGRLLAYATQVMMIRRWPV